MHEFSIAGPLLNAALETAKAQGGLPIEQVRVQIGRLRRVMPEALTFAFNALGKGTLADGAALVWEEIPLRVRCSACQQVFQPDDDLLWICPSCDAARGELLAGNELVLQSVVFKNGGR
jgi:hydrogenase nickel incorporation protein HypA/HybF